MKKKGTPACAKHHFDLPLQESQEKRTYGLLPLKAPQQKPRKSERTPVLKAPLNSESMLEDVKQKTGNQLPSKVPYKESPWGCVWGFCHLTALVWGISVPVVRARLQADAAIDARPEARPFGQARALELVALGPHPPVGKGAIFVCRRFNWETKYFVCSRVVPFFGRPQANKHFDAVVGRNPPHTSWDGCNSMNIGDR